MPPPERPKPPEHYDPLAEEPQSPMLDAINMALTEWSDGYAKVAGPLGPPVINRSGVAHGGALMTMLDAVAGFAGCWCPYPGRVRRAVTLSLTSNFVAAGRSGQLIAEGRVVGGGRSIYYAEARVFDENGTLLTGGSGVFRYLKNGGDLYGDPR